MARRGRSATTHRGEAARLRVREREPRRDDEACTVRDRASKTASFREVPSDECCSKNRSISPKSGAHYGNIFRKIQCRDRPRVLRCLGKELITEAERHRARDEAMREVQHCGQRANSSSDKLGNADANFN